MLWILKQSLVLPQSNGGWEKKKQSIYPEPLFVLVWWSVWVTVLLRIIHTRVGEKTACLRFGCLHEYAQAEGHTEEHGAGLGTWAGNSRVLTHARQQVTDRQPLRWCSVSAGKIISVCVEPYLKGAQWLPDADHLWIFLFQEIGSYRTTPGIMNYSYRSSV